MFNRAKSLLTRSIKNRSTNRSSPVRKVAARGSTRLHLERLDDRIVPSSLLVTTNLDDNSAGSLRSIIAQANSDGAEGISDTIQFEPSLNGDNFLLQQGPLVLTAGASVSIWSTNPLIDSPMQIYLDGDAANIFQVDKGAILSLNQITLAGGVANQYDGANGGAINNAGTLSIDECSFINNSATGMGGAIYNTGTLTGTYSSTFSGNKAAEGGAIDSSGNVTLNSNFTNNSATGNFGGAIFNTGNMTLSGTFTGDSSQGDGGAIYNDGPLTLSNSSLSKNTAPGNGGAIYNDANGTMTVIQSTLANNSSPSGGAIYNGGTTTLTADTVSANSALFGGGIGTQNSLTLVDTIVAGNTLTSTKGADPDIDGKVNSSSSYNLIGNGTGEIGLTNGINDNQVGNAKLPIDPKLGSLDSNGNMALSPGSPAIDAGGPVTTLTSNIGSADTTIPVADAAVFASTAAEMSIRIDNEQIWVTDVDLANNTITVSRGFGVDAASAHSAGASIYLSSTFGSTSLPPVSIGADQTVSAGPAVKFSVTGPTSKGEISGVLFDVTISALDANGNVATTYNGPVTLTCSDGMMTTQTITLTNGVGTTTVALDKAETADTLTATDGKLSGTSISFPLLAGPVANIAITVPSTATAGVPFNATITATDWIGNPASGIVTITSSDNESIPSVNLTNGKAVDPITLDRAGIDQLVASCAGVSSTGAKVTVAPGAASAFTISATSNVTAGSPVTVNVTAKDAYGNPATSYDNTLYLFTSDSQKIYPSTKNGSTDVTVTNGAGTNQIILEKADTLTLTLCYFFDHKFPKLNVSNSITVNPGPAVKLIVATPTTVPLDVTAMFTLTAEDQFNNVAQYTTPFGSALGIGATNAPWTVLNGGTYPDVNLQNGKGQGTFEPEVAGTFYLTFSNEGNSSDPLSGKSNAITVAPDWFSNNIPDPGIQALARQDFYANSPHALNFSDILGIFTVAESEYLTWAEFEPTQRNVALAGYDAIEKSLQALAIDGSVLNMPTSLRYLTAEVAMPSSNDAGFLAYYYSQNPDPSIPTVTTGEGASFGVADGTDGVAYAAKLTALVNQWFNGIVYPNSSVSGGAYNGDTDPPYTVAGGSSIAPTLYGPAGIPLVTDVVQGSLGDCWFLSSLAVVAYRDPSLIENMFTVNSNGTYTIHLYKLYPSGPHNATSAYSVYVTVDDELPTETGGFTNSTEQTFNINTPDGAPDFAGVTNGALWVALIEKAAAQLAGPGSSSSYLGYSYQALSGDNATPPYTLPLTGVNPLNWYAGNSEYSLLEITGQSSESWAPNNVSDHLKATPVINELNDKEFTILGTPPSVLNNNSWLVSSHEYAVLSYNPSSNLFLLYNPWGLQSMWSTTGITTASTTTIQVNNTQGIISGDVVQIDNEEMLITGVGNNTLTVQRGYDNTTPATHNGQVPLILSFRNGSIPDALGNQPASPFAGTAIPAQGLDGSNSVLGLFTVSGNNMSDFWDREDTTESFGAASDETSTASTNLSNVPTTTATDGQTPQTGGHGSSALNPRASEAVAPATESSTLQTLERKQSAVNELLMPIMSQTPVMNSVSTEMGPTLSVSSGNPNGMPITLAVYQITPQGESEQVPVVSIPDNNQKTQAAVSETKTSHGRESLEGQNIPTTRNSLKSGVNIHLALDLTNVPLNLDDLQLTLSKHSISLAND